MGVGQHSTHNAGSLSVKRPLRFNSCSNSTMDHSLACFVFLAVLNVGFGNQKTGLIPAYYVFVRAPSPSFIQMERCLQV